MLASGSADGTTILWDINFESWLVRAGRIANRNLSTVEWNQYLGPDSRYQRTFPNLPPNEGTTEMNPQGMESEFLFPRGRSITVDHHRWRTS